MSFQDFCLAHCIGNLPNLQFTGLTLHWIGNQMLGQTFFYFGRRYERENRLFIPLATKLHHSCADPFVLDLLLSDFNKRFANPSNPELAPVHKY